MFPAARSAVLHHTNETDKTKRYCSATGDRSTCPSWGRLPSIYNSLLSLGLNSPRPPHFQNILVSIPCILCQTELSLTLQEVMFRSHSNLPQMSENKRAAYLRKHIPGMQREKGQICGVAKCQIYSLIML